MWLFMVARMAEATCGLEACPPPSAPQAATWAGLESRVFLTKEGPWSDHSLIAQHQWAAGWTLAGRAGLTQAGAATATAPILAQLEHSPPGPHLAGQTWRPAVGAQLELPFGAGTLVHRHLAALPYVAMDGVGTGWVARLQAGPALTWSLPTTEPAFADPSRLGHSEHTAAPPPTPAEPDVRRRAVDPGPPIYPHEGAELRVRLAAGPGSLVQQRWVQGVVDLVAAPEQIPWVQAGAALRWPIAPPLALTGQALAAVTRTDRALLTTGAGLVGQL